MNTCRPGIFLVLLTLGSPIIVAQIAPQSANNSAKPVPAVALPPLPDNPDAVMDSAKKLNGFDESGTKQWHVRAKYEIYDIHGKSIDSGTYEEVWSGPKKYRQSYTGAQFTQIDYASAKGLYRSGNREWPTGMVGRIRGLVVEPLNYLGVDPEASLQQASHTFGQVNLVCIAQKPKKNTVRLVGVPESETYPQNCFMSQTPMLRVAVRPWPSSSVMWSNIILFQGRYVAKEITYTEGGKKKLTIQLESVEEENSPAEEMFTPATDAKGPITGPIQGPAGIAHQLHSEGPLYPPLARSTHVQGDVTLQFTVGKDGSVTNVKVLDGPGILRETTVDAVRKWRYEPMLIMGEPVEMNLKVVVHFRIG